MSIKFYSTQENLTKVTEVATVQFLYFYAECLVESRGSEGAGTSTDSKQTSINPVIISTFNNTNKL